MKRICILFLLVAMLVVAATSRADTFGSGANSFEIEFVTIGNPGNPSDTTGDPNPAGSVSYAYRIGKYEIPEDAVRKANAQSALDGAPLGLTLDTRGPNKPATRLSWFEAANFVNWLNTSTGSTPAYKFDAGGNFQLWTPADPGYDANNLFRNQLAKYFLPSTDEWYKAAYFDPVAGHYWDYPTGSNDPPTPVEFGNTPGTAIYQQDGPADVMLAGGASPSATIGHAGNVLEWEETEVDLTNDNPAAQRGVRGGSWIHTITTLDMSSEFRNLASPTNKPINVGFRIASVVPEPGSLYLFIGMLLAVFPRSCGRRNRASELN